MTVRSHEGVAYRTLVRGGGGESEGGHCPLGAHHQRHLEAVDPLGLRRAPPEGGLPTEQPPAGRSHPHHRRDEGGVQDVVDIGTIDECSSQVSLQRAQFGLQGSHAPVELALGAQPREVGEQVRPSEAPEVALAAEAGPLGEDRQGEDLRVGEQGRPAGAARALAVVGLPPVVYEYVQ